MKSSTCHCRWCPTMTSYIGLVDLWRLFMNFLAVTWQNPSLLDFVSVRICIRRSRPPPNTLIKTQKAPVWLQPHHRSPHQPSFKSLPVTSHCLLLSPSGLPPGHFFDLLPEAPPSCRHEHVQQEGPDVAEQCVCNQRPGAAGSGGRHRLLVVPGGGRHYAAEPELRHQDLAALRPLESLLLGRWVTRWGVGRGTDTYCGVVFTRKFSEMMILSRWRIVTTSLSFEIHTEWHSQLLVCVCERVNVEYMWRSHRKQKQSNRNLVCVSSLFQSHNVKQGAFSVQLVPQHYTHTYTPAYIRTNPQVSGERCRLIVLHN